MKIWVSLLCTEGWNELMCLVVPVLTKYCSGRYAMGVRTFPEPYPSDFGFNKFLEAKIVFNFRESDMFVSLDADTIITNHTISIESFLEDGKDFYICRDYNSINAGVFIIRKSEWSERFINYILDKRGKYGIHCEQNAIEEYMKEFPDDDKIKILPHPSINSYKYELYPEIPLQSHEQGNWNPGDFILHLPGIGMADRLRLLNETKEQIIYG